MSSKKSITEELVTIAECGREEDWEERMRKEGLLQHSAEYQMDYWNLEAAAAKMGFDFWEVDDAFQRSRDHGNMTTIEDAGEVIGEAWSV